MTCCQSRQIIRIVCQHDATAESDRRGDNQGVNREFASGTDAGEKMSCNPRNPSASGDHLSKALRDDTVYRLVEARAPIQLQQNRRRNPNRRVAAMCAPHCSTNRLMAILVQVRMCQRRDWFRIED